MRAYIRAATLLSLPVRHHHHHHSISSANLLNKPRFYSQPPETAMTKVLLTGGSGFIAAHILDQLLAKGHTVVTTVRSEEKAARIREVYPSQAASGELTFAIVPDIAKIDAFDEVVKTPGLEVVLHTASPFHFKYTEPRELIDPAVNGTTGILRAIARSAPTVKRVVVTSSFAAIVDDKYVNDPNHTFTEASWNSVTLQEAEETPQKAYRASKKLAERAAWDFVQDPSSGAKFELVTINPPMVYGPVAKFLHSLDAINTSNQRFVDCLHGKWRDEIPGIGPVFLWVDVRDVAAAHIKAGLELPEAAGKRLFATAGAFSNAEIGRLIRKNFPEDGEKLPTDKSTGGELPPKDKQFRWDNSATNKLLGIQWRSLEESVVDTVKSLKKLGA